MNETPNDALQRIWPSRSGCNPRVARSESLSLGRSAEMSDSEIVAQNFHERNPPVTKTSAEVIAVYRSKGRNIGICVQAPSDYREFAQFLVEQKIDSISLSPDTVLETTVAILEKEHA